MVKSLNNSDQVRFLEGSDSAPNDLARKIVVFSGYHDLKDILGRFLLVAGFAFQFGWLLHSQEEVRCGLEKQYIPLIMDLDANLASSEENLEEK